MRCANHRGGRGYDAGKKILGRKRHLVVDTLGLILGVLVTPANVSDPAGATQLLPKVIARFGWLRHFWADRTYAGMKVVGQLRAEFPRRGLRLEIVRGKASVKGFAVQPHRWIIERTFAWLTHNRRLVRDYEERELNSEAMILLAASKLMLKRLAKYHY
ncbi:MAG: transposase [Rhodospirillales bacterium]|nr:transposase [Acetobacter sp.]